MGGELQPEQEFVMGMDRRLRPRSELLGNRCRGTGVQAQVYKGEKTFKERRGEGREVEIGGGNKPRSFISIITIKSATRVGTGF